MSENLNNKNTNNSSTIIQNEDIEKENNKNNSQIKNNINENNNNNISNNLSKSKIINNSSSLIYSYPICLHNEKDPLDDYKLRVIKAKNKGSDTFLKNYLKFNFAKNDINFNNSQVNNKSSNINNSKNLSSNILENNKNNLFITADKKLYNKIPQNLKNIRPLNSKNNLIDMFGNKRQIQKSNSDIFNPYSNKAINYYKTLNLMEMEKRGHQYNKRRMASLQRIALHNFSLMNMNDNHYVSGSIPSGKSDESYILETKKRKKLPGIREYICYRLKNMRENETNTPEYYYEKFKKNENSRLPEIIDIKNSGRFKFHVYHDQYGFKKELDKRENRGLKMTKEKIRDLKIMAKINKINDPYLKDIYRRALYNG